MKLFTEPIIGVFDTEYTVWEGTRERNWAGPNEYREIVQIGAVQVDTRTLSVISQFSVFVRPVKNPELSELFKNLTGISQETIDREGVSLEEAFKKFAVWAGAAPLYCYGTDGWVLEENAKLLGISFPFDRSQFFNVKTVFEAHGIPAAQYFSSTIVEAFGSKSTRRGHDGLNDALTIVDGLRLLQAQEDAAEKGK